MYLFLWHCMKKGTYDDYKAKCTITKPMERIQQDDIPPSSSNNGASQLKAYKQLERMIWCELHHGHCFVDCSSGYDNHHCLDHSEMTLWAKMIVSHTTKHSRMINNTPKFSLLVKPQSTTLTVSTLTTAPPNNLITCHLHWHLRSMLPCRI